MTKTIIENKEKKLELVLAILAQAVEISNNTSADIFADFLSHVNGFSVRIYWTGWGIGKKVDLSITTYLDQDCIETLENILNQFNKFIEEEQNEYIKR